MAYLSQANLANLEEAQAPLAFRRRGSSKRLAKQDTKIDSVLKKFVSKATSSQLKRQTKITQSKSSEAVVSLLGSQKVVLPS